jgi:acid-sensing ion channel, other
MTLKFPNKQGLAINFDEYPLKPSTKQGLEISLTTNDDIYYLDICVPPSFIVHSPFELPGSYDLNEIIEFGYTYDYEVLITPEIIKTDASLRSYEPEKRGCYFEGEKKLKYFKVYTRRNCEFECLADNLQNNPKLNCTPFYMVRSDTMDHCDYRHEFAVSFQSLLTARGFAKSAKKCECLNICDSIEYKTEIITHRLVASTNDTLARRFDTFTAKFNFKFKDVDIVPLLRYQPFTFSDFLAQSGGMMGLFAGISVLSIIELFYFMTLRWMVNFRRWIRLN